MYLTRWRGLLSLSGVVLALGCASSPGDTRATTAPLAARASTPSDLLASLTDTSRAAVERAPTPALFFGTEPSGQHAVITAGPHFYAVSLHREGHSLALHGVDQVHAQVDDELAHQGTSPGASAVVRARPATILVNEGIRSVAWEEGGVYWSVEVECERPDADPRCTEDDYVLAEANALISLGGAQ